MAAVAVTVTTFTLPLGCTRGAVDDAAVHPLAADEAEVGNAAATVPPVTAAPGTTSSTTSPVATVPPAPAPDRREALRALVDDVLLAYDRALTDVAADPIRRAATGAPQRDAWDAVVLPHSGLSSGMLSWLVRRHQHDRTVVVPDGTGLSYRHRALLVEPPVEGAVSFTWCGHSPGLGIDATTREVVDDGVAHAHGTGQLRSVAGRWVLEALDESDLEVLAPGSPDPCPDEVDALEATETGKEATDDGAIDGRATTTPEIQR